MTPVFLIGGGWRAETFSQTYGRFLQIATRNGQPRIAIITADEDGAANSHEQFLRFFEAFRMIGLERENAAEIIVSAEDPLTRDKLAEANPTGVFVCGGLTPAFYDALCRDKNWLAFLNGTEIPYCGFSAGASIAARQAIIGGWRRKINDQVVEIANENAGEDLDLLAVRDGLGLVPFTIDVHATQWGTLTRLVHAVDARLTERGWALDENTMLEIIEGEGKIYGVGNAYLVRRHHLSGKVTVDIFQSG